MKTWKLVSGIISIIWFVIMWFQSCTISCVASLGDIEQGMESGGAGIIASFLILSAGITSIATRNTIKAAGNTACILLYGFAALIAFFSAGKLYVDLYVYGTWAAVCAVLAFISGIQNSKTEAEQETTNESNYPRTEAFIYCPHCGRQLPENSKFCPYCGGEIKRG